MITYPVAVETARFSVKFEGETRRGKVWPRADGMQIQNISPGWVILEESVAALPPYDPATQKLTSGAWVDDEGNQTAIWTRSVVALDAQELADLADSDARNVKRDQLKNAISTLRTWETQAQGVTVTTGNAVTTLQTMVDRMGAFFGHFADLLEVQRIDR